MFNLGKMLSSDVLKSLGGISGPASDAIAKALAGQSIKVSGVLTALGKALGANAGETAKIADIVARAKFVEILQAALEKAMKPGGNTKTQILDLRTRLDNLSREEAEAKMVYTDAQVQQILQTQQATRELYQTLSNLINRSNETAKSIIQNIR